MRKVSVVALILIIFTVAVALGQFSGTADEYSRYNTEWNGTSDFFGMIPDSHLIADPSVLQDVDSSLLLVIAPSPGFAGEGIAEYLSRGNTVLIFDQEGNANQFLAEVGCSIRVTDASVRSVNMEYKDTGLFRAEVLAPLFGINVSNIMVNYPGYVTGGNTIIQTSPLAWVDTDNDNTPDSDETLQVYSLAASETISTGEVIVIADPSILINSMLDRLHTENMAVINAMLAAGPYVYQAETMTEHGGGITGLLSFLHHVPAAGVGLIGGIFLALGAVYLWRRERL